MPATKTLPRRDEVPLTDRWDVESVFPTERAFEGAFAHAEEDIAPLARSAGTLAASARTLLTVLDTRDRVDVAVSRVWLYASMQYRGDATVGANAARLDRAQGLAARYEAAIAFLTPELLALPRATLEDFMREEPDLARYRHYLDRLDLLCGHARSAEVEEMLAQALDLTSGPRQIYQALVDADLRFGTVRDAHGVEVALAQGNSDGLTTSPVRSVRRAAWRAYADGYLGVRNTLAATLAGGVKGNVFYARAHRYASAREARLEPYNLPTGVFDTLIATVRGRLPLWRRYWDVRRRALGVAELRPFDTRVPLAVSVQPIPYTQGVETLLDALAPLGEEYVTVARRGLTVERWVDKYPNVGKGSGAFCTGVPGTHPFIMQNYTDSLLSLSTLAHELGHAMHKRYTYGHQPPIYRDYSSFVGETASNLNQALLRAHLLTRDGDRHFQIAVIEEGMSNFYRYLFLMPILARFEQDIHARVERGDALTADAMSAAIIELFEEGYGGAVVMDEADRARVGSVWAQFPHLYMNFYVWQYTAGIAAANALADGILAVGAPAAARYRAALQAGGSLYPLDVLRLTGVDMASPEPIERAFVALEGLIDRLDKLVGEGPLPWLPTPDC